jgi:hypothetical protein
VHNMIQYILSGDVKEFAENLEANKEALGIKINNELTDQDDRVLYAIIDAFQTDNTYKEFLLNFNMMYSICVLNNKLEKLAFKFLEFSKELLNDSKSSDGNNW